MHSILTPSNLDFISKIALLFSLVFLLSSEIYIHIYSHSCFSFLLSYHLFFNLIKFPIVLFSPPESIFSLIVLRISRKLFCFLKQSFSLKVLGTLCLFSPFYSFKCIDAKVSILDFFCLWLILQWIKLYLDSCICLRMLCVCVCEYVCACVCVDRFKMGVSYQFIFPRNFHVFSLGYIPSKRKKKNTQDRLFCQKVCMAHSEASQFMR